MKVSSIQMDMALGEPQKNFLKAKELIKEAMAENPDVIVLPETWNLGFSPRSSIKSLCDKNGEMVKKEIGSLAAEYSVNIVAGSVVNLKGNDIYNTCYVFDRKGECIAEYDKTHLFSPMKEDKFFCPGEKLVHFSLDGVKCSVIICYDIRFPELIRTLTLGGVDVLFVVSQWPAARVPHLLALTKARAIENQMFVCCCNSCGKAGKVEFGGYSTMCDPWGETLCMAEDKECILTADFDLSIVDGIRTSINVFNDRRPGLYKIN